MCGCINVGESTVITEFEKKIYRPDEIPKAIVSIDNTKCKVNAINVKFRLCRAFYIKIGNLKYEMNDDGGNCFMNKYL